MRITKRGRPLLKKLMQHARFGVPEDTAFTAHPVLPIAAPYGAFFRAVDKLPCRKAVDFGKQVWAKMRWNFSALGVGYAKG